MTPAPHLKFCSERGRLLDLVVDVTTNYARLVNLIVGEMSTLSEADYIRRRSEVEQARRDAEHAREALRAHQAQHGC